MHIAITANFRSVLILLFCRVFSKCSVMLMEDGLADTLHCTLQLQHGHRADMNFCNAHATDISPIWQIYSPFSESSD
jgi:hypothetical protein